MEDKELLEVVQKNYEESHTKWLEKQKNKRIRERIWSIIYILALISLILIMIGVVSSQTKKDVKRCIKMGYTANQCLK